MSNKKITHTYSTVCMTTASNSNEITASFSVIYFINHRAPNTSITSWYDCSYPHSELKKYKINNVATVIDRKLHKCLFSFVIRLLHIFGVRYFPTFGKHSLLLLYHIGESSSGSLLKYYTDCAIDSNVRSAFQF